MFLLAVLGADWLADIVLVHSISGIAFAYVRPYALSVDAIIAIRQTLVLRVFVPRVSIVAFAIIIRHALAVDARWGANGHANTVLRCVSLAATTLDAVGGVILRGKKNLIESIFDNSSKEEITELPASYNSNDISSRRKFPIY